MVKKFEVPKRIALKKRSADVVHISELEEVKPRRKANLPAVIEDKQNKGKTRISKLNTKGMRSILGDSAEEIQQLLESNENDNATTLMQKRMMQTLVDLIPYAEHAVRSSKGTRGVYQINSLLTSLRELIIDIQSTRDKGAIGAEMVERVLRPAFLDIGMILIQEESRLDNEIRNTLGADAFRKISQARKDSTRRIAEAIQDKYNESKEQAITFLQR